MREIKFRAWDKDKNKMIPFEKLWIEMEDGYAGVMEYSDHDRCYLDPTSNFELMQYTGLKDVNGQEIYEGDLYESGYGKVYTVKYDEDRVGFFPFAKDDGCGCCSDETVYYPEDGEVIGNIYQEQNSD